MKKNEDFLDIYDDFGEKIYRFIYYKTCHRETAEDLTSQTFLKAIEKWTQYNHKKGSVSAWLYGIARNLVFDHFRKNKREGLSLDIHDIWDIPVYDEFTTNLENIELSEQLHEILGNLPVKQREIIILRVWENLTYKEISRIMLKSEASCKMLFSRTIKKLKETMTMAMLMEILFSGINDFGGLYE